MPPPVLTRRAAASPATGLTYTSFYPDPARHRLPHDQAAAAWQERIRRFVLVGDEQRFGRTRRRQVFPVSVEVSLAHAPERETPAVGVPDRAPIRSRQVEGILRAPLEIQDAERVAAGGEHGGR